MTTKLIRLGGMIGDVFGNPLVEIEGPFAEDFTKLKWQFTEHRDGEIAKFSVGGVKAVVQDCDGDSSWWELRCGREVIAKGEDWGHSPHHFYACLAAAETALRSEVETRKRAVIARHPTRSCKAGRAG